MRSVRCDACGTKALLAASQCPKCGHLFEVRDGSGELLPLAHCPDCDSCYPAHVQSCKWCGTALVPEKARKGSTDRLRWIAAGAFAAAVLLGFLARDNSPRPASRARTPSQAKADSAPAADTQAPVMPDAPVVPAIAVAPPAPDSAIVAASSAEPLTPVAPTEVSTPVDKVVAVHEVVSDGAVSARTTTAPRARRRSSPWTSVVAKQWVIVRTGADRSARIVASVGPSTRVQLGEARGSWRRIKSRGIAGWVDASAGSFAAIRNPAHHARRMAGR